MVDKKDLKPFDLRQYPIVPLVGVGVMLTRDNSLLLVKRKFDPDAGYWAIPGGHLDLGEKVEDAAEREAYEETGFIVKVSKLAGIIDKIMLDSVGKVEYHYVLINYFVEQIEGNRDQEPIPNSDAIDARFVPFSELKDYTITDSLIELLRQLKIGFD
ncbi:MAG: NUDIX hydrolase [Promethearchaeota archaeon]|jgi:ADP-ribose pyrophosphatase YjhB (NUDIX family)